MNAAQMETLGNLPGNALKRRVDKLTAEQKKDLRKQCRKYPSLGGAWAIRFAIIQSEIESHVRLGETP